MERPRSIVLFERCYLGGLAVGLVNTGVSWNATLTRLTEDPAAAQLGAVRGTMPQGVSGILVVIAWVLDAIAVWLLFKTDSKLWFGEETA